MNSNKIYSSDYRSYLLRLVRVEGEGGGWRIRLQEARSGMAQSFNSLAELINFLNQELGGETSTSLTSGGSIDET